MSRRRQSVLLFTVLASQLLVGVHAAAHPPSIQADCEICSAYADPIDNLHADEPSVPDTTWGQVLVVRAAPGPGGPDTPSACPRGPPGRTR